MKNPLVQLVEVNNFHNCQQYTSLMKGKKITGSNRTNLMPILHIKTKYGNLNKYSPINHNSH